VTAISLLVLAAAAVPEGLSILEGDAPDRVVVPAVPALIRYLLAGVGALMIVTLILLRVTIMRSEGRAKTRQSRWRWVALILVGLALWATFAAWQQGEVTSQDGRRTALPSANPSVAPEEARDEQTTEYSEPFGYAVGGVFLLALTAMTVALLLLFRKDPDELQRDSQTDLIVELEAGLEDLHNIDDPRAAVIACYSRMETVVELAGVEHKQSDTPFELLGRLLQQRQVSEASARRLTELFEEAKFSIRPIDEPMRQEALTALTRVREELDRAPATVGTP
jgi:hypothetical protein